MTWKPPLLPDHYAAGESQKSMIYSYLLFLWYVRLDRTGVILYKGAGMHHGLCCRSLSRQVAGIAFRAVAEHEKA